MHKLFPGRSIVLCHPCLSSSSSCRSSVFSFLSLYSKPPPTPFHLWRSSKFMCGVPGGAAGIISHTEVISAMCGHAESSLHFKNGLWIWWTDGWGMWLLNIFSLITNNSELNRNEAWSRFPVFEAVVFNRTRSDRAIKRECHYCSDAVAHTWTNL